VGTARKEELMLLKSIVAVPVLVTSGLFSATCEVQEPYIGPGGFGAKSIKVIGGDNVDRNCIVAEFTIGDTVYLIVDQGCEGGLDYVHRLRDNRKFLINPESRGSALQQLRRHGSSILEELVDASLVIKDDLPSPFIGTTPERWMHAQGLVDLDVGDEFTRPIQLHRLSSTSWEADLTIGMTSDMVLPRFDDFGVSYAWFSFTDPTRSLDCWSIRVRGDLSKVVRWLVACGIFEVDFTSQGHDWTLAWNEESGTVELLRDGTPYEVFDL